MDQVVLDKDLTLLVGALRNSLCAFFLTASVAMAQTACGTIQSLNEDEMKALSPEAWRAYALRNWEFHICSWTDHFSLTERYRPPGDAEYVEAVLSSFHESLTVMKNRRTIPPAHRYLERIREPARTGPLGELFTYSMLSGDIYREDTCPVPKQGAYCIPDSTLTRLEASGKNGRAEIARMARESRIPPIDPWFLIGSVTIRVSPEAEQEWGELVNRQREAKEDYEHFKARRDALNRELATAIGKRDQNVEALNKKPAELLKRIVDIETRARPDEAAVRSSGRYRVLGGRIEKAAKRRTTIKSRIEHLQGNYPSNDSFAKGRIADLRSEDAVLKTRETRWRSERADLFAPILTNVQRGELKKLADRFKLERADADRRIAVENRRLSRVQNRADDAEARFRAAENVLTQADAALARSQRPNMIPIKEIQTDDAKILVVGESGIDDLIALNNNIAKLRSENLERQRAMNEARKKTELAALNVKSAMGTLSFAENFSVGVQFLIEAGLAGADLAEAYSVAGPIGAVFEGVRQNIFLRLYPPSYVTTDPKRAVDASLLDPRQVKRRVVEPGDSAAWQKRIGQQAFKQIGSEPYKIAIAGTAKIWNEASRDALYKSLHGETPEIAARIAKHQERIEEATDKLRKMTWQSGKGKAALRLGTDFAKGLAKSVIKEQLKLSVSDLIAEPQFRDFLIAQMALTRALVESQMATDKYWLHQNMLEGLRLARDQFRDQLDPDSGTTTTQNDPFYADPYYAFGIVFAEGTDPEQVRMRVTFGDVELIRDDTDPVWVMPEDARERFGRHLPEKLPLLLEFRQSAN